MISLRKSAGFTLIEMLVSMTIMVTVISLSSYTYRYFVELSTKQNSARETAQLRMQKFERVADKISGILDYYIDPKYRKAAQRFPLFIGERNAMYAVVSSAYYASSNAALIWVGVRDKKLVYCEKEILGFLPTEDIVEPGICTEYLELLPNVESFNIQYFGWASYADQQLANASQNLQNLGQLQKWFATYKGRETGMIPSWVELTASYREKDDAEQKTLRRKIKLYNQDPSRKWFYLSGSEDEAR